MSDGIARHWIDGEWREGGVVQEAINPATSEVIGRYWAGGTEEADAAIAAASAAFAMTGWRHDRKLRADVLDRLALKFEEHAEELATVLGRENGKLEARFELGMVPPKLRYYAALTRTAKDEEGAPAPGMMTVRVREPVGVAGIIVPWNGPVVLAIRSIAPALAAGCTVAVKMPYQTALTNSLVARLFSEIAELPRGVVNIFNEAGGDGARRLVSSPDTQAISFTGSSPTGALIAQEAGRLLKRCGLELGGKNPHLVFPEADLDAVLPTAARSITLMAGQFCQTESRLLVHSSLADAVVAGLKARLEGICLGAAGDPEARMGPLIDRNSVARVDGMVRAAIDGGAEAVVRGGPVTEGPLARGAFYRPTLLKVSRPDLAIVQEEIFGPVMTVQTFETEEEAIALANGTRYGLGATVWTKDLARAFRVAGRIEAGIVWINEWGKIYDDFEEGGYKASGVGRLNGTAALDDFLEIKQITFSTQAHAASGGH